MNKRMKAEIIQTAPQGDGAADVTITLTDEESHIQFLEIHMTLEEFGRMLHSPTHAECEFTLHHTKHLGWKAENKSVCVPLPSQSIGYRLTEEDQDAILAPFEVDGWRARRDDLTNFHRRVRQGDEHCALVTFFRHVPPEEG